ncbi:MAG: ribonuclease HII [Acidobacteriota bacterium]
MHICGVDEAGRGCLAGPVVAAAVILDREKSWEGIRDSKLLTPLSRKRLFKKILRDSVAWGVGVTGAEQVDRINVFNATVTAMRKAIVSLGRSPDLVLIDAVKIPGLEIPSMSIIGGDRVSYSVAAASIVAKVYRDSLMEKLHPLFPAYNFSRNKGYGTEEHKKALFLHGPSSIHRTTFHGVLVDV